MPQQVRRTTRAFVTAALPALAAVAPIAAQSPCDDFLRADRIVFQLVAELGTDGAALRVDRHGAELHTFATGGLGLRDPIPIASGSKLLSAAVLMTLVDDGLLTLDTPSSAFLPTLPPDLGGTTLRQLLSHTAGTAVFHPAISDPTLTLARAVDILAGLPLRREPGTDFAYGEVSMQIAGRIAEIASGKAWAQLVRERITGPLGMADTDYAVDGPTANPAIGAGARSTVADYARFLDMLRADGVGAAGPILSPASVATMFRDQTRGVPITSTPQLDQRRYGLGCWIDGRDTFGATTRISSPGAFGFWPWIDLERDVVGVLGTVSLFGLVLPRAEQLLDAVRERTPFVGVECFGPAGDWCGELPHAFAERPPFAGDPTFALSCADAPPDAMSVALIGPRRASPPVDLLGARILVAPGPGSVLIGIRSNESGRAGVELSLAGVPRGWRVFAQFVFPAPSLCGDSVGLLGSQGLEIIAR